MVQYFEEILLDLLQCQVTSYTPFKEKIVCAVRVFWPQIHSIS